MPLPSPEQLILGQLFWQREKEKLLELLQPQLAAAAVEGQRLAARRLGLDFDDRLANTAAADWARQYTDHLLGRLTETSQAGAGRAIAAWIEKPGSTLQDLMTELQGVGVADARRAATIATTEVTRAYAQGEKITYRAAGVERWKWNANRDELMCDICGPLNGKVADIGQPFAVVDGSAITEPPAHPNCRCWVSPVR